MNGAIRIRPTRRGVGSRVLLAVCVWMLPCMASAQILPALPKIEAPAPAAAPAPAEAPAAPAAPQAVPVPDIASRAELALANLRAIAESLAPTPEIERIEAELDDRAKRIETRVGEATRMIEEGGRVQSLVYLGGSIRVAAQDLRNWDRLLTERAKQLEDQIQHLGRERETWIATRDAAKESEAPPEILARVESVLSGIRTTREAVEKRRAEALVLQDRVIQQVALADATLQRIDEAKNVGVELTSRTASAVWRNDFGADARSEMMARIADAGRSELARLREFMTAHVPTLALTVLFFLSVGVFFRRARAQMIAFAETEPSLVDHSQVFHHPWSASAILTFLVVGWLHPDAPRLFDPLIGLLFLFPGLLLMRVLIGAELRFAPWVIAALVTIGLVRDFVSVVPDLEQTVLLAQILLVLVSLLALLRTGRLAQVELSPEDLRAIRPLGWATRAALIVGLISFVATAVGYVPLGQLLGFGVLGALIITLVVYAGLRAATGVVAYGLRVPPLSHLRMVERHRPVIEQRIERFLDRGAVVFLCAYLLHLFNGLKPVLGLVATAFGTDVAPGELTLSVGSVLLFGLTLWAAAQVSRFLRFVLEEDVYPRVEIARGLDYSVSSLLHYVVLALGFFLALGWVGLDLNRFTVIGGAFALGIGFGLQNIINNFVSGLILLFERPIQVGDGVQIGDILGEVRRIGIRSSTVRTYDGAEVIVPNASLIADRVTNWTRSDRTRRIVIDLGVGYGSDPRRVLALLLDVAKEHPRVLVQPEPLALFMGFGDSALNFRLQVWSSQDEWMSIRSDLHVRIYTALEEAGISIPFPQRDVRVTLEGGAPPSASAEAAGRDAPIASEEPAGAAGGAAVRR